MPGLTAGGVGGVSKSSSSDGGTEAAVAVAAVAANRTEYFTPGRKPVTRQTRVPSSVVITGSCSAARQYPLVPLPLPAPDVKD